MPDPLEALPFEIWTECIQLATWEQSGGPLELTLVSQRWKTSLLITPLLWTHICFRNGEDETARISAFLHLSADCLLEVDIMTVLPSTSSLQLIQPYFSRIKAISIRPSPPDLSTDMSLYRQQWKRAVSYILATFSHEIGPSDIKDIICAGDRYHVDFKHLVLAYPAVDWTSNDGRCHEESTGLSIFTRIWQGIISRILEFVETVANPVTINDMFYKDWNPISDAAKCLMENETPVGNSSCNRFVPGSDRRDLVTPNGTRQVKPPCLLYLMIDGLYKKMPKKGPGYRALVPLRPGVLLLRECPLIIHPTDGDDLQRAIAAMTPTDREQFYRLGIAPEHNSYGPELGTFKTNALRAGTARHRDADRPYSGCFRLGSGFNHSCQPNIHQHWNGTEMEFRALRYIAANEELCISYDIPGLLRAKSDRGLRLKTWEIDPCLCSACERPNPRSDTIRVKLGRVVADPKNSGAHTSARIFGAHFNLQNEGLYHFRETLLYDGYLACREEGDLGNAQSCLTRALDAARIVGGKDPRVVHLRTMLQDHIGNLHGERNTRKRQTRERHRWWAARRARIIWMRRKRGPRRVLAKGLRAKSHDGIIQGSRTEGSEMMW